MRVRFFNTFEPVSPVYRDLLPLLGGRGFAVEAVITNAKYRAIRDPLEEAVAHPNVMVTEIPFGGLGPSGRFKKLSTMSSYAVGAIGRSLFGQSCDLNVFLTQPPLFSVWGYVLRVVRGQPYYCLIMDVYPDLAVHYGALREDALITQVLYATSRFALRKANEVIVIGRCMADYVESMGVSADRIHVIPNWADEDQVHPIEHLDNPLREELGLNDEFIVLYSGNMGAAHDFDDVLQVARRCRDLSDLLFIFVGDGVRRCEIEKAKQRFNLDNVMLLPFQPFDRLAQSLSLGDLHFISLRDGFEGLVVPSKAYGSLAAGRPILYQGSETGEIACMVHEEKIGSVVDCGDVDALEQSILRHFRDRSLCQAEGCRARRLVEPGGRYSRRRALEDYADLITMESGQAYD